MKRIIIAMALLAIAGLSVAQNPLPIEISYDAAGNRIMRKVLQISMMSKGGNHTDSTYYIDQMQSVQMVVYPNPTQGKIYVELPKMEESVPNMFRLYDNQGKLIYESVVLGNTLEIDISLYPTGCYMVELYVNGERTTWKLIKQ